MPKSDSHLIASSGANHAHTIGSSRLYLYISAGLIVTVIAATTLTVRREYHRQMEYWRERLTRIADTNERWLRYWVEERDQDIQLLASSRYIQMDVLPEPVASSKRPAEWEKQLHAELDIIADTYSYAGAYVLDRAGRIRAESHQSPILPAEVAKAAIKVSQAETLTLPAREGRAGYSQLAFVSPIQYQEGAGRGRGKPQVIGDVILTRPEAITAVMSADVGATSTGETVLVTIKAGKPVFISPLRLWSWGQRAPAPPPGSPAALSLRQKRPFFGKYLDYRGVQVLTATRFLPELQWGMVTKVDRSEALAQYRQTLISDIGLGLFCILGIVGIALAWGRQQRVQRLQTDLMAGKQTEQSLRQSEERFWVALQNSPVVVFNQDRELRYTWIHNPQPPWSEQDYRSKTDEEIIGIVDGNRLTALKRPVLETGVGARKEWSFVCRGEKRVYDINIQPLRNEAGEVVGITCAGTDVTERKRGEERLREYEKVVEGLQEMIVVVDRNYRYLIANRAFLNYRGFEKEQVIGRSVAEVLSKNMFEGVLKAKLDDCLQGNTVVFEMKHTYPGLGERDLLISYFPIEGRDGVDRIASVLQDITDRKRAEEALLHSEAQLRAFIANAPYGIFRFAGDHFLSANPALVQMLGYANEEELLGLNVAHEVFHPTAECPNLEAIFAQEPYFGPIEARWKRRDGTLVLARLRGRVAIAQNGAKAVEAIAEDITQWRAMEEHLGRSDRLGALGRLASGVAHDFNNLLLGITLNLEHAIQRAGSAGTPVREDLEQALHAARAAASLTRQLLMFGRKRTQQPQPVNLNELIIRSQDLVNRLAGENIHVNLELGPNLGPVKADPVQVQQVILNLVANARDAMAGGGQITIRTRNIDLRTIPPDEYFSATPKAGNYVVLEVSDTGVGISREGLTRIFEPFYTTKEEGNGLGLSTSSGIVTESAGYMSVRTELGRGTTVKSYLPQLHEPSPLA